jgi:ubiquinone/menaquinone biosynthesis C-methylase UbiE
MARRRAQLIPWRVAGGVADEHASADAVVRETGWVFNNETGEELTLAEFVMSGNKEVNAYLRVFGMNELDTNGLSLLEIGSGIGRMTARFTKRFASVIAADVDAAFLERCRETVARHGDIAKLRTSHVADGHSLAVPSQSVDAVFSYITLQHCSHDDALKLTAEALRVVKPGGTVILNYRTWVLSDVLLVPAGGVVRLLWKSKRVGGWVARQRWATRLGWQANRVAPAEVLDLVRHSARPCADIVLFHQPRRSRSIMKGITDRNVAGAMVRDQELPRANKSHWWLVLRLA